jgi:hypothetical protein
LGIDVKSPINVWNVANYTTAVEYNLGESQGDGPTIENFAMDWECRGLTQWLKDCTILFGFDFLEQHKANAFPSIKGMNVDIGTVKSAFRDYVLHLKRQYIAEDVTPIEAANQRTRAKRRARSVSRRHQVCRPKSHIRTVLSVFKLLGRRIALLRHHQFPERCIDMVENSLGVDAMSSEDSDGEVGTQRNFRIKSMPWRDQDLTIWLRRVDALPTKNAQNFRLMQRWTPRKRIVSDLVSTRRKPVPELPLNFYRSEWLMEQDRRNRARLKVDPTPFVLPRIDDFIN